MHEISDQNSPYAYHQKAVKLAIRLFQSFSGQQLQKLIRLYAPKIFPIDYVKGEVIKGDIFGFRNEGFAIHQAIL